MKVNVFDTLTVIKNYDGCPDFDIVLLDKFNEMLDQCGIAHAFCEPRKEDLEADEDAVVTVMYNAEDGTKFFLAYGLFRMTYMKLDAEKVKKAMLKHCVD